MKTIFRKAITVLGSAALVGASIGAAAAASYPSPFTSNTAVVFGSGAGVDDTSAVTAILSNLNQANAGAVVTTFSGGTGATEPEIPLGVPINATPATEFVGNHLVDSEIEGLLDEKISWDDGGASGSDDYNVHEEIHLGGMLVQTSLAENDFEELAAIINDRELEYRYVFDDAFNYSAVDSDDSNSEDLYLSILGKRYEIKSMTASSITVVTSEEVILSPGESVTVDGKVFTLEKTVSGKAIINGEIINEGVTETVDGLKVEVDTVAHDGDNPSESVVVLKIGDEISKTYSSGQEYIGEPEEDYQWEWNIANLDSAGGYIGVKYSRKETDEDDEVAYIGESYIFPEGFGEVSLDGLTDVDYEDFEISFDQLDLYNSTTTSSVETVNDAYVMVISAVDGRDDAITTVLGGSHETNKIYLRWAAWNAETEGTQAYSSLELFYSDVDGTVTDAIRPRFSGAAATTATNNTIGTDPNLADITVGDITYSITADVTGGNLGVTFTNDDTNDYFTVDAGGVALAAAAGDLKWFGGDTEGTSMEVAESTDLVVNGTSAGTLENEILAYDGLLIEDAKGGLEKDEVVVSIPSEQVFATVSIMVNGETSQSGGDTGVMSYDDTEAPSDMNLIVVGGSAINSVAAQLLGVSYPTTEGAFTTETGVAAGQALIQSFARNGKVALLVAGYDKADTARAATYLINDNDVDTSVGSMVKLSTATESVTVIE